MNNNDNLVIQTTKLTRRFADFTAVNSIDIQVAEGSVYGFLGENGAGKTTTIRMLLGLIKPDDGTINIFGQNFHSHRVHILSKTGSLVEMPSLYSHLTGQENLEVIRRLNNIPKKRISEVFRIVNLEHAANKIVKGYSLGMRQRLGIAIALLPSPSLLILDEPTNGLDPSGILEIRELIKTFPKEFGITVFISSHLLSEVELVASHIGIINKGNLIFQDSLQKLLEISQDYLLFTINDGQKGESILKEDGILVTRDENNLMIPKSDTVNAGKINKMLVNNGIEVSEIIQKKPKLEEIFLHLTK